MSRAYRITVKESETRHLKAGDEICTDLEILEILPPEDMGTLLRNELARLYHRKCHNQLAPLNISKRQIQDSRNSLFQQLLKSDERIQCRLAYMLLLG